MVNIQNILGLSHLILLVQLIVTINATKLMPKSEKVYFKYNKSIFLNPLTFAN